MKTQNHSNEVFYKIQSKGILGLKTNMPNLKWSFGQQVPLASEREYAECVLGLSLFLQSDDEFKKTRAKSFGTNWGKYHYFSGEPDGKLVYYKRPLFLGSELYLEGVDLTGIEPLIRVNRNYDRFVHYRFMNLHSVGFMLTDVAALLLLNKQLAPIHCSAFRKNGNTVVVFAPSNTGKTLTTMMACMEHGADFISEDLAITDGTQVFALPWTSTFRYYGDVDRRLVARLKKRTMGILPFLDLFSATKDKSIIDYLPENRICHRSTVNTVVILERGDTLVENEDKEVAFRKILNLNRSEFNYQRSLINNAYEFFNPDLDIAGAYKTECTILRQLVNDAHDCLIVRTDNPTQYADLLLQMIAH